MSPHQNKPAGKDEPQTSAGRKTASSRPPELALNCPRCDSPNTKFCYYNNYSLTQPRHFCKTCRRYWTKGGALRNVPIGGGCRKNKKLKSSPRLSAAGDVSSKDSIGSSDIGGLKFFQGVSPAMDFQISFPRLNHGAPTSIAAAGLFSQFSSLGNSSNTCDAISSNPNFNFLDPNPTGGIGFTNFPISSGINHEMGSLNVHSSLASSIESLSSINQDLHWKLQQQRLAMIPSIEQQPVVNPKPQPIMFDISKQDQSCARKDQGLSTEWFFDNSFTTMAQPTATTTANWTGIQPWNTTDFGQYTASSLP